MGAHIPLQYIFIDLFFKSIARLLFMITLLYYYLSVNDVIKLHIILYSMYKKENRI